MNIQLFTYSVTRRAGGVFDAVHDLFTNRYFAEHDINVISYYDDMLEQDMPAWKGMPMQLYKAGLMLYSHQAKKALLASRAELLHMETLWRWPHLWMTDWKQKKDCPIVCSPHGMLDPWIIRNQGRVKRLISNMFFQKGLEAVTCYHALCKKELEDIRAYGLKQPIAIIPNGINLPDPDLMFEKTDNKKHLLYLGRLHKKKGVDLLLKALAAINREEKELLDNWQIDLVGWDHEGCKTELENIVSENRLEDKVVFHGGLFGKDKQSMYANADGYILPSHGEGLPMTVLEAWSWKLPVVMTPECHIPEGYDADAAIKINDNVESVEEGLRTFLGMSDEEKKAMGMRGYDLVRENFTWDVSAKKMIEVYEWLLGKGKKPDFVYR